MRVLPDVALMVRRLVARRPWIQWVVIAAIGVAVAASVADAMADVEAERASWGTSVTVWVAADDLAAGDPIVGEAVGVPASVRPPGAIDDLDAVVARQAIGKGEIIVRHDVAPTDDELALAPAGWLVAPVEEHPPSGAGAGDRVQVASDGIVLATDGIVVGAADGVTLVAVPADVAPMLPLASSTTRIALLRVP